MDENQRQQLQAIASLKPQIDPDGTLLFDFAPRILGYLRTKGDTSETERSGRLHIADKPLEPVARINYDPQQGLEINTGYALDDDPNRLVSAEDLLTTADGEFAVVGDEFRPIKPGLSDKAKAWLKEAVHRIDRDKIPEFFLRDLVLLKRDFNAVLVDEAQKIHVLDEAIKPVVRVKSTEPGWLDFQIEYECAGYPLPDGLLPKMTGQQFVELNDTTWLKVNQSSITQVEQHLEGLGATTVNGGYRLPITEFSSLEEFVEKIGGRAELSQAYQEFLDQLVDFCADDTYALSPAAERESDSVQRQTAPVSTCRHTVVNVVTTKSPARGFG